VTEPVRVVVDGESFVVVRDGNTIHFTWVSGPNESYGFSVGGSGAMGFTDNEVRSAICAFLAEIDPHTGYLAE
jgi:hypothetical protein